MMNERQKLKKMFDVGRSSLKQLSAYGAKRHHYSMFNVGRSMLDVHFLYLYVANMAASGFLPARYAGKSENLKGTMHPLWLNR